MKTQKGNCKPRALSFEIPEISQSPSVDEWFQSFNQLVEDGGDITPQQLFKSFEDSKLNPREQVAFYKSFDDKVRPREIARKPKVSLKKRVREG
ncbi:hypothetical protein Scep_005097 [Stephania cephalantha]|uniref:Uncharacterized protein n=1 Tax=Stephania cephalantha TaxID=152367 RepID=A0AAP0KV23_9MAGN